MADGIEQIESRLAAYIDGELPEGDRAEIEKYLAANPSHRVLIAELKQQKLKIADLPRESAPLEVLDHLQSHLERQSLLDNVDDGADSMRIHRWPQWGAVAAMLLLTVGLGALVFSVLPGGALNHESVVIAPPTIQNLPAAPKLDDLADKPSETENRDAIASSGGSKVDASRHVMGKAGTHESKPGTDDTGVGPLQTAMTLNDGQFRDQSPNVAGAAPGAVHDVQTISINNGSAIVVSTDDPSITQNLLAGYLGQNNYEFTPVRAEVAKESVDNARMNGSNRAERAGAQMNQPADQAPLQIEAPPDQIATQQQSLQVQVAQTQITQADPRSRNAGQALGEVVDRVATREQVAVGQEQYLVVRNLTPADAERINSVINSQRGMRQQSRLYNNYDLYPELAQQNAADSFNRDEPRPATQQYLSKAQPDQHSKLEDEGAGSKDRDRNASAAVDKSAPTNDTPASPPASNQNADAPRGDDMLDQLKQQLESRTDLVIVLRNDPKLDEAESKGGTPTIVPDTQPSTQPATRPSEIETVPQIGNQPMQLTNDPASPTTQPDTQPALAK